MAVGAIKAVTQAAFGRELQETKLGGDEQLSLKRADKSDTHTHKSNPISLGLHKCLHSFSNHKTAEICLLLVITRLSYLTKVF